jgi:hypothetical protein
MSHMYLCFDPLCQDCVMVTVRSFLPSLNLFPSLKRLSCHPHIWKYLLFSTVLFQL